MKSDQTTISSYEKLTHWLFTYTFVYAFFHILPAFLNYEIKNLLMIADIFDILTPFVMIFVIYRIYLMLLPNIRIDSSFPVKSVAVIILIFGAISFVEGHGMHLSANAIARHLTEVKDSSLFALDYSFDEILGHIFWDGGIVILSLGIILVGVYIDQKKVSTQKQALILLASLIYGFTYFVNAVEGQTVFFTLPLAVFIPLAIWWTARRLRIRFSGNPVLLLFFLCYIVALGLFLVWGIWQKGFPEFSELGWI
jgi:hypothetical protein